MTTKIYNPPTADITDAIIVAVDEYQRTEPAFTPSSKEIQTMIETENPTWKINDRKLSRLFKKEWKSRSSDMNTVKSEDGDSVISSESATTRGTRALKSIGNSMRKLSVHKNQDDHKSTPKSVSRRVSSLLRRKSKDPSNLNIVVNTHDDDTVNLLPKILSANAEEETDFFASPINQDQPTVDLSTEETEVWEEIPSEVEKVTEVASEVEAQTIQEPQAKVKPIFIKPKEEEKVVMTYVDDNDGQKEEDCICNASICAIL